MELRAVNRSVLACAVLFASCCFIDFVFLPSRFVRAEYRFHAIADNAAHGAVALLSWILVSGVQSCEDLRNAVICGFMACAIDLDHFIAAKSFSIKVRNS